MLFMSQNKNIFKRIEQKHTAGFYIDENRDFLCMDLETFNITEGSGSKLIPYLVAFYGKVLGGISYYLTDYTNVDDMIKNSLMD